ncbi:hypothetical protein [Thalassospira mesophila]|uniref:hypothetical protein n=1 Tax=Thalassospira mesophila TaxID=1293891 RepID=UPI000A1D98B9|nr:hypothetical protein [Thalassospira mesophila]
MSIGADWRQLSPGAGAQTANGAQQGAAKTGATAQEADENGESGGFASFLFGDDGFDFGDIIDVINPLQHIPVVGALYRELTGDQMGNAARVVGGGLFGGIFGLAGAAIDAAVEGTTGEDTGAHVLALFEGDDSDADPAAATAVAQNDDGAGSAKTGLESAAATQAGANGLVLPWSVGDTSMASVMAGNQPGAQQAQNQALPFGKASSGAENVVQNPGVTPVSAASQAAFSAGMPFAGANNAAAATQNPNSSSSFEDAATQAGKSADPAELAVTLARAGHSDYASKLLAQRDPVTSSARLSGNVHINHDKGATVWQRAGNTGRVAGPVFGNEIQGELIKARSQQSAFSDNINPAMMTDAVASDGSANGPVLSAAEMAARFNSALGLGPMAQSDNDTGGNNNAPSRSRNDNQPVAHNNPRGTATQPMAANADTLEAHPLVREAEQHNAGQAPVGAWFSQTMMDGLQKYQAMQKQQRSGGSI